MIKGQHINFGFQRPVIKIEDHIFGAGFGGAIINPSGQYDDFLPLYEPQADNFETQGCTVWGTENALEILHKFKFGVEKNYEELPVYIGAGVRPESGGDPNTVSDWVHHNGLTESPNAPFPTTLEALQALLDKPLPQFIVDLGLQWLTAYEMRHQWVLQGYEATPQRIEAIKSALPYGVLGVSVTAWFQNSEGVYIDNGLPNSHWCVCYGWTDKGWKIFDSYTHEEKIYSFDSAISFAKLYFLNKIITSEVKKKWYDGLVDFFRAFLSPQQAQETINQLKPILMPDAVAPEPKYKWAFPSDARKSVRIICDEMGLSVADKNLLCQVIHCESGFRTDAVNHNKDGTTDFGIIQANTRWYIGSGKPLASIKEAVENPEKCIRIMIARFKQGGLTDWICFRSGQYKTHPK